MFKMSSRVLSLFRTALAPRICRHILPSSHYSNVPRDKRKKLTDEESMKALEEGNDADTFGTLSRKPFFEEKHQDDKDDFVSKKFADTRFAVPRPSYKAYSLMIKRLLQEKRLPDAIDVLEKKMIHEDNRRPNRFTYKILISACARVGYTEKAFFLYRQMRMRGITATPPVYTSLFNACANSPFPNEALELAKRLRIKMEDNGVMPTTINYHAMIKAFGRCGDLATAFEIADDMVANDHSVTSETFAHLLQTCASDKKTGFRHAMLVWRKMRQLQVPPSVYTYNLMLRCVRDCGIGDVEGTDLEEPDDLLTLLLRPPQAVGGKPAHINPSTITTYTRRQIREKKNPHLQIEAGKKDLDRDDVVDGVVHLVEGGDRTVDAEDELERAADEDDFEKETDEDELEVESDDTSRVEHVAGSELQLVTEAELEKYVHSDNKEVILPNILFPKIQVGNVVALTEVNKPEEKLMLLGGLEGLLKSMKDDGVQPTIKTFTQLIEVIPSDTESEEMLLKQLEESKVRPDIDFYNVLMKKRIFRKYFTGAHDVLKLAEVSKVAPDIATFGILALSCLDEKYALRLLDDMEKTGFRVNVEIMGTLVKQACYNADCKYLIKMLNKTTELGIESNTAMLEHVEKFRRVATRNMIRKDKGEQIPLKYATDEFQEGWRIFCLYYNQWLQKSKVELPAHPWDQYRRTRVDPASDEYQPAKIT